MTGTKYKYEKRAKNVFTEYFIHTDKHKGVACDVCGFNDIRALTIVDDNLDVLKDVPDVPCHILCYNCLHIARLPDYIPNMQSISVEKISEITHEIRRINEKPNSGK